MYQLWLSCCPSVSFSSHHLFSFVTRKIVKMESSIYNLCELGERFQSTFTESYLLRCQGGCCQRCWNFQSMLYAYVYNNVSDQLFLPISFCSELLTTNQSYSISEITKTITHLEHRLRALRLKLESCSKLVHYMQVGH